MKENDSMIIFFLVFGILIGVVIHSTISSLMHKTDAIEKVPVESVHDSRFKSFEYHNHKYLKYTDPVINAFSTTLHDPDCPCWTNRMEVVNGKQD